MQVTKRDGKKVEYNIENIRKAIYRAAKDVNNEVESIEIANKVSTITDAIIQEQYTEPTVEQIQDTVEITLMSSGHYETAKEYIIYREEHKQLREKDWVSTELAKSIWTNKYQFENETIEEFFERVTNGNKSIIEMMKSKVFSPAGRILANRGLQHKGQKITFNNCYVNLSPRDNIESIFLVASEIARTFSYGGGTGVDISKLRPNKSKVNNSAKTTSGACTFMQLYDVTSKIIGQHGRRAALMITLDCSHPDIENFIDMKNDLNVVTKANISIKVSDKFMESVVNNKMFDLEFYVKSTGEQISKQVSAQQIFNKIAHSNWRMAEPGFLFWDKMNNWSLLSEDENFEFTSTNPCFTGDTLVAVADGRNAVPIEQLAKEDKDVPVYCLDKNKKLDIQMMRHPRITGHNKKIYEITLDSGHKIKCTGNHEFILRNGDIVETKDLTSGMSLFSHKDIDPSIVLPSQSTNNVRNCEHCGKELELPWDKREYCFCVECIPNAIKTKFSSAPHDVFNQVVSIKYTGKEDVYNGTVDKHHNFAIALLGEKTIDFVYSMQCGELPLPEGGSCLLSSINLSEIVEYPFTPEAYINYGKLDEYTRKGINFLNEVLDDGISLHPLPIQRETATAWRPIGLGIMGLADMFLKLGVTYGSSESVTISEKIGSTMINSALQQSAHLAKENGTYPRYDKESVLKSPFLLKNASEETLTIVKKYGLRNSQLLSIAPTGTISNMFGISGGIEPIFALSYTRKTEYDGNQEFEIFTPIVSDFMEVNNISEKSELPPYFVTSHDIDYKSRIDVQSAFQKYFDSSISSTVNLHNSATVNTIKDLYLYAWKKGVKGITIYRDGCMRTGILSTDEELTSKEMTHDDFVSQNICPECKSQITRSGGCVDCKICGFSQCTI